MAATIATHSISSNPIRSPYVAVLPGRTSRPHRPVGVVRPMNPARPVRPVRPGRPAGPLVRAAQPTHTVYLRRRVLVVLVLFVVGVAVWTGAGRASASRSTIASPAQAVAAAPAGSSVYVARDGDTMWSIASSHHGEMSQVEYTNQLIELNGGSFIRSGQVVVLP